MDENTILSSIEDLNLALYNYVLPLQLAIPELEVMGFGSGINRPELPRNGIRLNLYNIEVDRERPTPLAGHPVRVPSDLKQDFEVEGELYEDIPLGYTLRYPLPVLLSYELDTWCYRTKTQLALDMAILTRFPERGVLYLPIDSVEYQFPIELIEIVNLDDLKNNFRERIYRFSIEAWVESHLADTLTKIITTSKIEAYEGNKITDTDVKLMDLETKAETP